MLITFYGSVPNFKEAEPIKNLCISHGLLVTGNCSHFVLWFPFSWVLRRNVHTGIVLYSWTWQIQHMTQILLFTCDDCITRKGCSEVLLIDDMLEKIHRHPVTMSCKVLQQWTQSRYILITLHIYSEEINSDMKYLAGINASLSDLHY
jgi:hypothetical protein